MADAQCGRTMPITTTLKRAASNVGGDLQVVSKMPGYSTGIPAKECKVGSRLREVPGSTCETCYAFEGFYKVYKTSIDRAQYARLEALDHPEWVESMVRLITHYCTEGDRTSQRGRYFRWHHSGDLQSLKHLWRIIEVVKRTPNVYHWIPTREYRVVATYRRLYGEFPDNVVVRQSAHMVDHAPPSGYGLPTSTVVTDHAKATCPAPDQGNACLDCRACWDPNVDNVAYQKH